MTLDERTLSLLVIALGIVVSSLHSRTDTRVFAKPVQAGRSRYPLSDEEQDAIRKALAPAS